MLNETNASLAGTADHVNWNLIAIIISIFTLVVTIIALYPSFAAHRHEKKKERKNDIEKRLDLFYIPLQDALKNLDIERVVKTTQVLKKLDRTNNHYSLEYIINTWYKIRENEDYKKASDNDYLALDKTKDYLTRFTNIFESNELFRGKIRDLKQYQYHGSIAMTLDDNVYESPGYSSTSFSNTISKLTLGGYDKKYEKDSEHLFEDYNNLKSQIEEDIALLKGKLEKLVNS